jgi:hypothetical protein
MLVGVVHFIEIRSLLVATCPLALRFHLNLDNEALNMLQQLGLIGVLFLSSGAGICTMASICAPVGMQPNGVKA